MDLFDEGRMELQVKRADTGELLGWKSAFLPMNLSPGHVRGHIDYMIAKFTAEAETRQLGS